jgi:capsular polysaccharide biosynthesis protein
MPQAMHDDFAGQWRGEARLTFPARRLAILPGGRAFSNRGLVIAGDDTQVADFSGGAFAGLFPHPFLHEGRIPKARRVRGSVAVFANGSAQCNYYHWLVEVVPRMQSLRDAGLSPDFYFVPARHRFHRAWLQMLGVPEERIIAARKYTHIQADELICPSILPAIMHRDSADFLNGETNRFSWSKTKHPQRLRVYIARKPGDLRHVVNEMEVLAALEPLGFRCYFLEDLSIEQQIALFQQADFVIGPHGAGLVNAVFCNGGTKLVEIGTPARPSGLFYYIAQQRGLVYRNFYGEAIQQRNAESYIRVDVPDLVECIRELAAAPLSAAA